MQKEHYHIIIKRQVKWIVWKLRRFAKPLVRAIIALAYERGFINSRSLHELIDLTESILE